MANENHETGGEFVDLDTITEQCANVKTVCIQATAPSVKYDGEIWQDTSTNPPTTKIYDLTNTAWMTRMPVYYASESNFSLPQDGVVVNGFLKVQYDGSGTVVWAATNGGWRPMRKS